MWFAESSLFCSCMIVQQQPAFADLQKSGCCFSAVFIIPEEIHKSPARDDKKSGFDEPLWGKSLISKPLLWNLYTFCTAPWRVVSYIGDLFIRSDSNFIGLAFGQAGDHFLNGGSSAYGYCFAGWSGHISDLISGCTAVLIPCHGHFFAGWVG